MNNMERTDLLKDICRKEEECGCYSIYIDGIPLYRFVRYEVRVEAEKGSGFAVMETKGGRNYRKLFSSTTISFIQLLKIVAMGKRYEDVFISFPRVEKVNGLFIDKFTDPVIDLCGIKNYVIFDHGRGGVHPKPRHHNEHIIYSDFIHVASAFYEKLFFNSFCKRHQKEINELKMSVSSVLGRTWDDEGALRRMVESFAYTKIYTYLLKKIRAKRVIGPARDYMQYMFIAVHKNGMKAYELQHGVTYSESELYSGKETPEIEPDAFFAFGDNKPDDVYGISPSKIVNIGWAFQEYLIKNANSTKNGEKDVLVISDPEVSEAMVEVVDRLATEFKESVFYFRPHPHEVLSQRQKQVLSSHSNVWIHDTSINLMEALYAFNHVIGESSTALYEAMSLGKKVGRLFMMDLHPQYLEPGDKDCSWEIYDEQDFRRFLNEDISTKKSKSIYSKFDKEKFLNSFK